MTIKDLKFAVKCCTSLNPEWEETCGKCPFNSHESEEEKLYQRTACIDSLLTALAEYLPEEE